VLFNSFEFLIFLLVTYTLYRLLPWQKQNWLLLAASYVFYAWWDVRFLLLIAIATAVDYSCALLMHTGQISLGKRRLVGAYLVLAAFLVGTLQWSAVQWKSGLVVQWGQLLPSQSVGWAMVPGAIAIVALAGWLYPRIVQWEEQKRRNRLLWFSVVTNLAILGFFKYFNFFVDSLTGALNGVGVPAASLHLNIALPVGISFYTFRTLSYTIDVWRGKLAAEPNFSRYGLFLAFFPSLLAGPIDRAGDLLPQINQRRALSFEQTTRGLFLILFGLFKKVAIANGVAGSVTAIYQGTGVASWLDVIAATLLYTVQIYCDFSGYSDMARGVAKLFGFDLMLNFNLPYFSKDPSEFWRRWHISLSTWLRDYLYIPLGGNRKGNTYANLMTTMALGGLWHGATWNFVLWGFYQGALLCGYRAVTLAMAGDQSAKAPAQPPPESASTQDVSHRPAPKLLAWIKPVAAMALFFGFTCYGWLLFGVTSFERIAILTRTLVTDIGNLALSMPMPPFASLLGIPLLIAYELVEYRQGKPQFYLTLPTPIRGALYAAFIFIVLMGGSNAPAQFIYSQF
jgi:alginate O-acetyltransferase complex protein AlgI